MRRDARTIEGPPFGRLVSDGQDWVGEVLLAGWEGFHPRPHPVRPADAGNAALPGWEVEVRVEGSGSPPEPPTSAQERAFAHLTGREPEITEAVQRAILAEYPRLRELYGYDAETAAEIMPEGVESVDDLQDLIGLHQVHVPATEQDGLAYVGFELGCSWDEEHGLGVMTHGSRVLEVGQADASFQAWTDERDLQRSAGGDHAAPPSAPPAAPAAARRRTRWWEFWK